MSVHTGTRPWKRGSRPRGFEMGDVVADLHRRDTGGAASSACSCPSWAGCTGSTHSVAEEQHPLIALRGCPARWPDALPCSGWSEQDDVLGFQTRRGSDSAPRWCPCSAMAGGRSRTRPATGRGIAALIRASAPEAASRAATSQHRGEILQCSSSRALSASRSAASASAGVLHRRGSAICCSPPAPPS